MSEVSTDANISAALLTRLKNWRFHTQDSFPSDPSVQVAIALQYDVGWDILLEEWIPLEWETLQNSFYQNTHSRRTGRSWSVNLIRQLWTIAADLWKHRNKVLHDQENNVTLRETETRNLAIARLAGRLHQLQLDEFDKWLTEKPIRDLYRATDHYKAGWIRSAKAVIKASKSRTRNSLRQARHMRMVMNRWLSGNS